jgi:hypothetical protein
MANPLSLLRSKYQRVVLVRAEPRTWKGILEHIKGIEPQVRNAEHLRQSRILIWVSTLKLRDAQYNIGHKYVSNTESYQQQNTAELVDEVNTIHLFK